MITPEARRDFALSLPDTQEKETWGEATFRVRDKIFVMLAPDGAEASVKMTPADQHALVGSDPKTFTISSYTGRFGWITVRLASVAPEQLQHMIIDAWRRTVSKRLVAAYAATEGVRP